MAIVRVTITGVMHGCTIQNVLHMRKFEPLSTDIANLSGLITSDWINVLRSQQVNLFNYTQIMVQRLDPLEQAFLTPVAIQGAIPTGTAWPTVMSVVLSFRTNTAGRSGRGRVYIGGLRNDASQNNVMNTSNLTAWQALADSLESRWCGANPTTTWSLGVCPRTNPAAFKEVTVISPKAVFGVQRRRNTGVGI